MQIWNINLAYKWSCRKITVTSPSVARKKVEKIICCRKSYNSRRNWHELLGTDHRSLHLKLVCSIAN